jgi:hypothetical protein
MGAVDANMVLIAKGGDRDIDVLCSVLGGLGLGELDRPACVAVLLALGGLGFSNLGDAAFLDRLLLRRCVALLGTRDYSRVNDLSAHGEDPPLPSVPLKASMRRSRSMSSSSARRTRNRT